jgi:AcrR family transcriptional regulator
MPKTSEEKKLERINSILNAAMQVFSVKGYWATTLDEIAERASVSKGLLYTYFNSKEDIFLSLLPYIDEMTHRKDIFSSFLEQTQGMHPVDRLLTLWDAIMREWSEDGLRISRLQIEFWLEASKIPRLREILVTRSQQSMDIIQSIIRDSGVKLEPSLINAFSRLWWAQIDGLVGYYISRGKVPDIDELSHTRLLIARWCRSLFEQ